MKFVRLIKADNNLPKTLKVSFYGLNLTYVLSNNENLSSKVYYLSSDSSKLVYNINNEIRQEFEKQINSQTTDTDLGKLTINLKTGHVKRIPIPIMLYFD